MLCDVCHIKEATLSYTVVVGETSTTIHICEECAKKKGILPASGFPLSGLLLNAQNRNLVCKRCGLTYQEFADKLKFGCSGCYEVFGNEIKPFIKKIQEGTIHKGRFPSDADNKGLRKKRRIIELKKALKKAIDKEAYERASEIRDKLVKLENEV